MIDEYIRTGRFDPLLRFSVAKFTRFTKSIDSSPVEYFFNLDGKIALTNLSSSRASSLRHNFTLHLFHNNGDIDMTNWDKFRILEFADEEQKCFYTGSLLLKHDMAELGRVLDQAVLTGGSIELTFQVDTTLKKDATSSYLDIIALQSLAVTNTVSGCT